MKSFEKFTAMGLRMKSYEISWNFHLLFNGISLSFHRCVEHENSGKFHENGRDFLFMQIPGNS